MQLYIITGGSKGFGASLVRQAVSRGDLVLTVSRSTIPSTSQIFSVSHDLKNISGLSEKLESVFQKMDLSKVEGLHLINNAAVLLPVGSPAEMKASEIQDHLSTNFMTPVLLTSWFLQKTKDFKSWKTVTNISSGAASHPIQGWSLYCSSKAGLKMFTENMQVENSDPKIKFLNFSPGVMDTDMQATIRKQPVEKFSRVQEFQNMKKENQLRDPENVAKALIQLLENPSQIRKVNYDIKEMD